VPPPARRWSGTDPWNDALDELDAVVEEPELLRDVLDTPTERTALHVQRSGIGRFNFWDLIDEFAAEVIDGPAT
jgi:hypothetical protein